MVETKTAGETSAAAENQGTQGRRYIKRPDRPDRSIYDDKEKVIKEKIEDRQNRIAGIKSKIDTARKAKSGFSGAVADARNTLNTARSAVRGKIQEKTRIRDQIKIETENLKSSEGKSQSKGFKFSNVEEVDERISSLESRLQSESLPIREEKNIVQEINKLRSLKDEVKNVLESRAKASKSREESKLRRNALYEELKSLDEEIDKLKKEEEAAFQAFEAEKKKQDDVAPNLEVMAKERDQLFKEITDLRAESKAMWDEFRVKQEEFKKLDAEFKKELETERKLRREQNERERKERTIEWIKEKAVQEPSDPLYEDKEIVRSLVSYVERQMPAEKAAAPAPAKEGTISLEKGQKLIGKKSQKEEEVYFVASKGKKSNKTARAPKPSNARINHTFHMLQAFSKFNISAPATAADCPKTLDVLRKKLTSLEDKTKDLLKQKREENAQILKKLEEGKIEEILADLEAKGKRGNRGRGSAEASAEEKSDSKTEDNATAKTEEKAKDAKSASADAAVAPEAAESTPAVTEEPAAAKSPVVAAKASDEAAASPAKSTGSPRTPKSKGKKKGNKGGGKAEA
eukprot:Rmarinus@m.4867